MNLRNIFINTKNIEVIDFSGFDNDTFNDINQCLGTDDPVYKEGVIILTSNSNSNLIKEKFRATQSNSHSLIFDPNEVSIEEEIEIKNTEALTNTKHSFSLLYNNSIIDRIFMTKTNKLDCNEFDKNEPFKIICTYTFNSIGNYSFISNIHATYNGVGTRKNFLIKSTPINK